MKYVVVSQRLEQDHVGVEVQNEVTLAVHITSQLSPATGEVKRLVSFVGQRHIHEVRGVWLCVGLISLKRIRRRTAGGRKFVRGWLEHHNFTGDSINDLLMQLQLLFHVYICSR